MFEFTKMIREIDIELKVEWQPGAFKWADENMDSAHTYAVNRFEHAIVVCTERCDWVSLQKEAEVYRDTMLKILRAFKQVQQMDEQTSFLESLQSA